MKRFILLLCALALLSPCKIAVAEESGYSRILTDNTGFYSDVNGSHLKFYLPYGYYVKILEMGSQYTKVSYMSENATFPTLTGYVKTIDVITCDYTPVSPYPLLSLSVISDDVLFSDSALNYSKVGVYVDTTAIYYGEITNQNGVEVVYVYCNGYLGYVRKNAFAPFSVPVHPYPVQSDSYSESQRQQKGSDGLNLQILVVAGISVIVVSLVYLIFRPGEKKEVNVTRYYDDEP